VVVERGCGLRGIYNFQLNIRNAEELEENFKVAASESKASFNDDRLLIEKYIEEPRHVEFQILGDQHGHVVPSSLLGLPLDIPPREGMFHTKKESKGHRRGAIACLDPRLTPANG